MDDDTKRTSSKENKKTDQPSQPAVNYYFNQPQSPTMIPWSSIIWGIVFLIIFFVLVSNIDSYKNIFSGKNEVKDSVKKEKTEIVQKPRYKYKHIPVPVPVEIPQPQCSSPPNEDSNLLKEEIEKGFQGINGRMDRVENKVDQLNTRVDGLETKVENLTWQQRYRYQQQEKEPEKTQKKTDDGVRKD